MVQHFVCGCLSFLQTVGWAARPRLPQSEVLSPAKPFGQVTVSSRPLRRPSLRAARATGACRALSFAAANDTTPGGGLTFLTERYLSRLSGGGVGLAHLYAALGSCDPRTHGFRVPGACLENALFSTAKPNKNFPKQGREHERPLARGYTGGNYTPSF